MADDVKIGSASIDVRADDSKLKQDYEKAKSSSKKAVDDMNAQLSKIKMSVDSSVLKMKFSEAEKWRNDLQAKFEKQIKMNADVSTIQKTKAALDSVNSSLSGMKKNQDDVVNNASKWGMIATGVQSVVMAVRDFVSQMKQLIGQSVTAAADLNVLRSNFKGNAEDLELFRQAVAGTVSDGGLIKLSNRATDLKMSMEDQAIAFSFAEDRADSYGGSVEENFNKIVNASEGMGRGLKEIGIETKVYEENLKSLVKEHGGSLEKLDAETQKTIMLKATIMSLGITLDDVKKKQKDEKDLIDAAGVSVDEARLKLGNFILGGLVPLLKKFDESGSSIKGFITGTIAIGGTLLQMIPLLVQVYTAKKLFTSATLMSAAAVGTETAAVEANTVAKVANSRVVLGMLGTAGAILAVGAAVIALTAYINDNTKAIKANREAANINTGFGQSYGSNKPSSAPGTANLSGFLQSRAEQKANNIETQKYLQLVSDVETKIAIITTKQKSMAINSKELAESWKEIARLQKLITAPKETTGGFFESFDKQKTELAEVNRLLTNTNLITGTKEEKEVKINILLEKQAQLLAEIYKYEHPDTAVNPLGVKGLPYKAGKIGVKILGESASKDADPFLKTLKDIDDEFKTSQQDMKSFANTIASGFAQGIMAGDNLGDVFKNLALQLAEMAVQALIFKAIMAAIEAATVGWLGLKEGGTVINEAAGGTVFNGARLPAFAGGTGSYMVPNGYPNDSYPVMVQSGEDLRVRTPQQRAMAEMDNKALLGELRGIRSAIRSTNIALASRSEQPIIINADTDAVKFTKGSVNPSQVRLNRGNVKSGF